MENQDNTRFPWSNDTMQIINSLTPDVHGKAFDPDWFLLRQRFESFEAEKVKDRPWISVEESLPPPTGVCDGGTDRVLVYLKRYYQPLIAVAHGDWTEDGFSWYFDYSHMLEDSEVTHWMPLPDHPKRSE